MGGGFGTGIAQGLGAASQFIGMMEGRKKNLLEAARFKEQQRINQIEYGPPGGEVQPGTGDVASPTEGLAQRRVGVAEQNADTAAGQLEALRNTPEARYNARLGERPLQMMTTLSSRVKEYPELGPAFSPLIEEMKSNPDITRADVIPKLYAMESSKAFQDGRQAMYEKAVKLQEQGKVREAQNYMTLYEATNSKHYERLVDTLIGKPQSMWRTASEQGAGVNAPVTASGEKFWDDRTKSWMQKMSDGSYKKIAQASGKQGRRVVYDANGNIVYEEGESGLTTKTQGEVESGAINAKEETVRLRKMVDGLNPEYLTVGGKAAAWWYNMKEKLDGDLTPDEQKYVGEFASFAQDTVENINLYIKRITGAQMSEKEANRLRLAMPDMGDGALAWLKGDGYTKFLSKANNAINKAEAAAARMEYYKSVGMNDMQIQSMIMSGKAGALGSFEQVPSSEDVMAAGEAIEQQLIRDGVERGKIDGIVESQLKARYPGFFNQNR